jgi:hypothetical protein
VTCATGLQNTWYTVPASSDVVSSSDVGTGFFFCFTVSVFGVWSTFLSVFAFFGGGYNTHVHTCEGHDGRHVQHKRSTQYTVSESSSAGESSGWAFFCCFFACFAWSVLDVGATFLSVFAFFLGRFYDTHVNVREGHVSLHVKHTGTTLGIPLCSLRPIPLSHLCLS